MNISWVLADSAVPDPTLDPADLKHIGALWGSWRTWRAWQTDNVICHDMNKTAELLKRNFQTNCNFYMPNSFYTNQGRPAGVKLYEGEFVHDVDRQEEIVALHLAASINDIVLLLGFDFTEPVKIQDRLLEHRAHHYRSLVKKVIENNTQTQWVLINHPGPIMHNWTTLNNIMLDNLSNVLMQMT
jgi:hypothetical protein